jgi:hypothetical protein
VLLLPAASAGSDLTRFRPPASMVPGDRVLCLYDSTDGTTERRNPLSGEVAAALGRMGLSLSWRDVAREGLPRVESLAGFRAVATGFMDGKLDRAADFCAFVEAATRAGVRVVVVGSFGAYQERSTGAFLPAGTVNRAFGALGVRYDAEWTDDPSRLAIEVRDPALGDRSAIRPEAVRHFYQFTALRPDVRTLVAATRKDLDRDTPPSAVVFTSATGAMALSRYLSPKECLDDPEAMAVRLDAFVRAAIARVPADRASLLVLHDPRSADSRRAVEALSAVSAYAGIPMVAVDTANAGSLRPADLSAHAGVVLAVTEVPSPEDGLIAGLLRDDLSRGGRVVSLLPLGNATIAPVIAQGGPSRPKPVKARGLRFLKGAFPGLDGLEVSADAFSPTTLMPALGQSCSVLAEAGAEEGGGTVPLWWRCGAGRGTTTALNAFELVDRATLGIVLQAAVAAEGFWAMPVPAAAVEFVDDCPLPMTGSALAPLGKPDTAFYREDFYGMMREAVKTHRVRPTFMAVFSYEDRVRPPFDEPFGGPAGAAARDLAAQVAADDLSIGLHGMNHMSPALAGGVTASFPDAASLRAWFQAGRESLEAVAGPQARATVYVPPNDWIDRAGKDALVAAVPGVQVLAAVFNGTNVETEQDFGPDPHAAGVIDLPRTWAGYALTGEAVLGMVNGVLLYGTSTHFIHPDDVLDPERSGGRSWRELRAAYLAGLGELRRRFPFLRDMTALEAGAELRRLAAMGWTVSQRPGGLEVTRTSGETGPVAFMVRTPAGCGPVKVQGGGPALLDVDSGVHFLRMDRRVMTVRCGAGER